MPLIFNCPDLAPRPEPSGRDFSWGVHARNENCDLSAQAAKCALREPFRLSGQLPVPKAEQPKLN